MKETQYNPITQAYNDRGIEHVARDHEHHNLIEVLAKNKVSIHTNYQFAYLG